jgi:hypothetical protein
VIHYWHDEILTIRSWKPYDEVHGDLFPMLARNN